MRIIVTLATLALLGALTACESTGAVDASTPDVDAGGGGRDGGPPPAELVYTPDGCGYEVRSPVLASVQRSEDVVGPSPRVDHVHLSWSGPSSSTFAVNWRSDVDTLVTQVVYGTDRAAVEAADAPGGAVMRQLGHTFPFVSLVGETTRIHEAHVCGLTAATAYYYKVGGPGAWSRVFETATGPAIGATTPFRFAVTGDSRNDSAIWAEVQASVDSQDPRPSFQLFSGDAVVLGVNQPEWDSWFEASHMGTSVEDVLSRTPFMFANGNHDALAINWVAQFAFPQDVTGTERGTGEEWYSFDYANTHFVVLNDTAGETFVTGVQRDWLDADLRAVDRAVTPWIIVVHHKPMYSCATAHGSDTALRAAWQPLFDRYDVDLVFNGHDHDYERSKPMRGFQAGTNDGQVVGMGEGTIYVVAAGAGAPLYGVDSSCYHTELTESVRNFVVVDIAGNTLTVAVRRLDGSMLDTFTVTR